MTARRISLVTVVSLCSLAAGLLNVSVALAATPPVIEEVSVSNVAGTSATFQAKINPEGSETTYRFEYGTSEAYGSSIPIPDGLVGSGSVGVTVRTHPQDLAPSTDYHYRVVAVVASRSETVTGVDGTFVTQSASSGFALPDGRQWELVSPSNKHGALMQSLSETGPIQAAEDGSGINYGANVPTEAEPAGYGSPPYNFVQVHSVRGAQGWSTHDIATPHASTPGAFYPDDYKLFSGDLSLGLAFPAGSDTQGEGKTLLSSEASELTPYIRRESLCDDPATVSECYLPILTGKEGFSDVPPGTVFGDSSYEENPGNMPVEPYGASPDLHHVLLSSRVALTETPTSRRQIYEWSSDTPASKALQLVSVLPQSEGGGPAEGQNEAGVFPGGTNNVAANRHSISNDGSRIFWVERGSTGSSGAKFYMRDTVREETVRLDAPPGALSDESPHAGFQIASSDGSKVFFTDFDNNLSSTTQQGTDLYECEIVEEAGKLACHLTDLTPVSQEASAEVGTLVLGAAEDGSRIYFVASAVLGDGAEHGATPGACGSVEPSGTCNLYEAHNGVVSYITTLSVDDDTDWGANSTNLANVTARVSPSGRYLAFMSDRQLTGYDNRDSVGGIPDAEVYLYDALSGHLTCVSCNPTGSRPTGVNTINFTAFGEEERVNVADIIRGEAHDEYSVAANLPGGNEFGGAGFAHGTLYQPRALSDSGRLFFNSNDALVSQDVNGQEDAYEFDPEGDGGCTGSSVTFDSKSGGCVGLISSGASPEESGFLDASVDGSDVFFLTSSRLTSQDYDRGYDVYDAHECSAGVPCVSLPVSPPPCDSGDSCKGAPSLQPSIFGAPASATFSGAGNVVLSSAKPVVGAKSLTRAQQLARALKACRKKPKRKRAGCERQARARYGAKAARKATRTRKAQG